MLIKYATVASQLLVIYCHACTIGFDDYNIYNPGTNILVGQTGIYV